MVENKMKEIRTQCTDWRWDLSTQCWQELWPALKYTCVVVKLYKWMPHLPVFRSCCSRGNTTLKHFLASQNSENFSKPSSCSTTDTSAQKGRMTKMKKSGWLGIWLIVTQQKVNNNNKKNMFVNFQGIRIRLLRQVYWQGAITSLKSSHLEWVTAIVRCEKPMASAPFEKWSVESYQRIQSKKTKKNRYTCMYMILLLSWVMYMMYFCPFCWSHDQLGQWHDLPDWKLNYVKITRMESLQLLTGNHVSTVFLLLSYYIEYTSIY